MAGKNLRPYLALVFTGILSTFGLKHGNSTTPFYYCSMPLIPLLALSSGNRPRYPSPLSMGTLVKAK